MKSKAESSVCYQDDKMFPERRDCYLTLMQFHDDLPKEALRRMMLNQENDFRNQVQELHRLYQIQMILMKNSRSKEVISTRSLNCCKQEQLGIWSSHMQMLLDLEVSTCHSIDYSDAHFFERGNGRVTSEKNLQFDYYLPGKRKPSLEEVELSLSIGENTTSWKRSGRKRCSETVSSVASEHIIDLEGSPEMATSIDVKCNSPLGCAACSAKFGDQSGSYSSCGCTTGMKKHTSNWTKRSFSLVCESTNHPENCVNQGIGISVGKAFTTPEIACFDLNMPHVDESSFDSKDCIMLHSLDGASPDTSEELVGELNLATPDLSIRRQPNVNCSNEISTLNSVVMVSDCTDNSTNMGGRKLLSIDLESCSMSPSDLGEDHDCLTRNSLNKDDKLVLKFLHRNSMSVNMAEMDDQIGEELVVPSYIGTSKDRSEDANIESSLTTSKSDRIAVNADPSSSLKTVQSGTRLEKPFSRMNSFQNSESSQVESPGIGESKSSSYDVKGEGSAHSDALIQKGAVSLIYLSLGWLTSREDDCISEVEKTSAIEKVKRDQPECSLDSFESMVLKLPESNGDCCVTSNPYKVDDMDMKDSPIKLRRGRRMKDFQKDILPGLASLSRHEICEDIRIMEGVIRSREYKRLRSKMATEQNWFAPVRSKRSRLNYIGRKFYN